MENDDISWTLNMPVLRVLAFSTVFPNADQPAQGLFVLERLRHAASLFEVRVVSPVAWFRGRDRIPHVEQQGGLEVEHPTFYYVPGILKCLDGFFLFCSSLLSVARLRRYFDFDVIDAHFGYPDGFAAVLLGQWIARPVTVTLRGSELEVTRARLRRWAMAWALRRANRVLCVSHQLADLAVQLGVDPSRIDVIPNGVDTRRFFPVAKDQARRALDLSADGKLVVMVGHIAPVKGFDRVIHAIEQLRSQVPHLKLAIVGGRAPTTGRHLEELQRLARTLGVAHDVILTGRQTPDQVAQWINAADVLVLASHREGCPNVVWEALACGRPVVATAVGEVPEMVPPYGGILVKPTATVDELRGAIAEALARPWDAEAIRAYASRHRWETVADRVADAWQKVGGLLVARAAVGSM